MSATKAGKHTSRKKDTEKLAKRLRENLKRRKDVKKPTNPKKELI